MLSVTEAQEIVLFVAERAAPVPMMATAAALGFVIADDIISDLDLPPFRKAMMDGFAVRAFDCAAPNVTLNVIDEITAGRMPSKTIQSGESARIMTGAPLPDGADAVVMIEQCIVIKDKVTIATSVKTGHNIQPIGREMKQGDFVVAAGTVIQPAHIALLATLGQMSIRVYPSPTVAILATGDELVSPDQTPKPGQIRNSNAAMLLAQCVLAKAKPRYLGIARDDRDHLRKLISDGLTSDILILSGGVSAGKLDLVPEVLKELGVKPLFHKIAMKPGKPLLFGCREQTLVFGLPGNPVSSFVGFELFVRPATHRFRGIVPEIAPPIQLPLAAEFHHHSDRPTYHPSRIEPAEFGETVQPTAWHGSPDLRGLAAANSLCLFPAGEMRYDGGSPVPVFRLPR